MVAVGTRITPRPAHRSRRALCCICKFISSGGKVFPARRILAIAGDDELAPSVTRSRLCRVASRLWPSSYSRREPTFDPSIQARLRNRGQAGTSVTRQDHAEDQWEVHSRDSGESHAETHCGDVGIWWHCNLVWILIRPVSGSEEYGGATGAGNLLL